MNHRVFKNRAAWLAARKQGFGIGASDTAAILGRSKYAGPWKVWASHKAPELVSDSISVAAHDGIDLEPAVVRMVARRESVELVHHDFRIDYHPTVPWLRCSPDATEGPIDAPVAHWEVKCVFNAAVASELPPSGNYTAQDMPVESWGWQALHQLACMPTTTKVVIVVLCPWFEIRTYTIHRTKEAQATIAEALRRVQDFRQRFLVGDETPELDDSRECSSFVDWRNPAPSDWHKTAAKRPTRNATPDEVEHAVAYAEACHNAKQADTTKRIARNRLVDGIGEFYRLNLPGGGKVTCSAGERRRITVKLGGSK